MRTNWHVSALPLSIALALVLGACGTHQEQTATLPDDLKQDLAVASASAGDLATAPQSYQRMRFVSSVEQFPAVAPARRPTRGTARHMSHSTARHQPTATASTDEVPDPIVTMASEAPAPVAATEAAEPEASTIIVQSPVSAPAIEPASEPAGSSDGAGNRGHGSGIGGILGGIIGSVVIRGGAGGIDHCDPRRDGRARPTVVGRPDFGMPMPTGRVFGGMGRR